MRSEVLSSSRDYQDVKETWNQKAKDWNLHERLDFIVDSFLFFYNGVLFSSDDTFSPSIQRFLFHYPLGLNFLWFLSSARLIFHSITAFLSSKEIFQEPFNLPWTSL